MIVVRSLDNLKTRVDSQIGHRLANADQVSYQAAFGRSVSSSTKYFPNLKIKIRNKYLEYGNQSLYERRKGKEKGRKRIFT